MEKTGNYLIDMHNEGHAATEANSTCSGLLTCLFCGGDNMFTDSSGVDLYNTCCDDCGACGPVGTTSDSAKELYKPLGTK